MIDLQTTDYYFDNLPGAGEVEKRGAKFAGVGHAKTYWVSDLRTQKSEPGSEQLRSTVTNL